MPPATVRAVFLSYASQDAEAAKRICEALRSGGVEVWFDQEGGLEHGDEWDAKIRRQIKECVLFIPLISANTQARHEGYFRIEWDLAAERARGIASGVPFILPVVIDDTREPDALVPDRFRAVQWTRLRGGEVPAEVRTRFLKLWSHRTGALSHEAKVGRVSNPPLEREEAGQRPALLRKWALIALPVGVAVAALGWWIFHRSAPPVVPLAPATPAMATSSQADQLVTRAYAHFEKMNYTRANLAAAEDLTRKATDLASDSNRAWAARAYVQSCFILRGWDVSEKRRQDAQDFANRALALDPNATEAMLALAYVLINQNAHAQAEVVLRRALALRADDPRLRLALSGAIGRQGRTEEAMRIGQETVKLFPRDPLAYYSVAGSFLARADFAAALENFDAAITVEPFAGALLAKASLLAAWRGDLAAARAALGQLAPDDRTEDRAVGVAMWLGLLEHNSARVHEAAALTARNYLDDSNIVARGPKASSVALAFHLDGKESLARQQWQAAESVLRQRLREHAESTGDQALLATVLGWLGRTEDAAREIASFEATAREQPSVANAIPLAKFYASVGDAAKTLPYLRRALNKQPAITYKTVPLDPWWDKLRGQPEFEALLAETKARSEAEKK
ncbi:MAG: TIR domain-containing protein [Verrucomicrobia bacterium]|nr:TIR domain-containing protein [Verrucomicrobiota bacterium]